MTAPSADTSCVSNWNLPNFLTVPRILGVPMFLWVLLQEGDETISWRWWLFVASALLMATDKSDGHLTRSRNLITDSGKTADPIADKALMLAALTGMNIIETLPWRVTVIIVTREGGITIWRMFALRQGCVAPASRGGKIKTVLQSVAVGLSLMPVDWLFWPSWIVMIAVIVVAIGTGIRYVVDVCKVSQKN